METIIQPIKPSEVKSIKPNEVLQAFNELIQEHWEGERACVKQDYAADLISKKLNISKEKVFEKKYLDVEEIYRDAGWKVTYNKPGYNENWYPAYFIFEI